MQITRRRVALLSGVAAGLLVTALAFRPKPIAVETAIAQVGPLMTTVDEDAKTRVPERYEISSPVAGHHMRIEVHPGDPVQPGDVLVRIQATPLDPRQSDELEARLRAAVDLEREASSAIRIAQLQGAQAEREYARIAKLAASGVASTNDVDQARTSASNWKRETDAARSRWNAARHNTEVIRASIEATAPAGAGLLTIAAPVHGRVLTIHRESEGTVLAGAPILDVGDPATLEVVIDVLSREAVKISAGQDVIIDGWGGSGPLHARVNRIEPSAFTKVSALGIEEQRVNVIAVLDKPPATVGDQFEVQAHVVVWSGKGLKVPSTAVFHDGQRWTVLTVEKGRARTQVVDVGHRSADEVEITNGLRAGAVVINHPSDQIRDGVRVAAGRA